MKKSVAVVLITLGVLLGVILGMFLASVAAPYIPVGPRHTAQARTAQVVVAARDLHAQTKLAAEDTDIVEVAAEGIPANSLVDRVQVVGAKLKMDVRKGQALTTNLITREMTMVDLLHEGTRGFSLSLLRRDGGVGLFCPGSIVDLHVTFPISDKEIGESLVIAPLLQQLRVLAVDGETVLTESEAANTARRRPSGNAEVILEVTDAQARVLQLAHQRGKVALPLRNPTDTEFYPVQPMIIKQGQFEPFGDPLDPQDPAGLMMSLGATLVVAPSGNDPNTPIVGISPPVPAPVGALVLRLGLLGLRGRWKCSAVPG